MCKNVNIKKVMIIGSGPIIIGQAAEFDYSGTQACKAIKEEGIKTILVNSNPATIMTDLNIADKVYIEPLNIGSLEEIIKEEKPDGLLAGFGGQTALNLGLKLKEKGILDKYEVNLLGVNEESIKNAEDRKKFKNMMVDIDEPVAMSIIANNIDQCTEFVDKYGFPVIIRPAFTLGGTGGGIADNYEKLIEICERGISTSPIGQILLEQSVAGWKEIEYEVIRDSKDNCIIVCNMENLDPVGIHTGDSIVVAPSQTLRDKEYHMLRQAAIKIVRGLKIEGGCNVQFALDTMSSNYIVIEVNPRVSRSSALASKAAGYPIAKIAAKIAIGYTLDELKNYVTQNSSACFEPSLDYVVVKIPKLPFDKFKMAERSLGTQMKATGEVMAIDRIFEGALLKAVTCLEGALIGLKIKYIELMTDKELVLKISKQDDERLFAIAEAFRRKISIEKIKEITKIDMWFLQGINNIVQMELKLRNEEFSIELIHEAEVMGFTDAYICECTGLKQESLDNIKKINQIHPVYKMVDTCSGEFESKTPYYYSCYELENENFISNEKKIIVIGSGPIRIGQGIEFDYSCVQGVWAIKEAGYQSIIINNNPETVSTDFDIADKLYFESLYIDDVMNVIRAEKPEGVIVQLGGQTSINLAQKLQDRNVKILGTSVENIDAAEDRDKFRLLLNEINIPTPKGIAVTTVEEALKSAIQVGYPVVVRPSYVIGGRAMQIVYDEVSLKKYIKEAVNLSKEHTIIVDKYIKGIEIEVDAISDGEDVLIPGIMEHVERTGVHSGDSIAIYPPVSLKTEVVDTLVKYTKLIAKKLNIIGLINIQYAYDGDKIYVIEVNPRASRTVPILSKVTQIPMVKLAVDAMIGKSLKMSPYGVGLKSSKGFYAVKVPVFSSEKISNADMYLSPEMKSTGEVLGIDKDLDIAIFKAFSASGINIPVEGAIYLSLNDIDKNEGVEIVKKYSKLGFNIYVSNGTGEFLKDKNIECSILSFNEAMKMIASGELDIVINTPTIGNSLDRQGFKIRKKSLEMGVNVFTCIDTARIFTTAIEVRKFGRKVMYKSLNYYFMYKLNFNFI